MSGRLLALAALALAARATAPLEPIPLRVMTYNLHSCKGLDRRVRPDRVARLIARYHPDVVALQEVRVARGPAVAPADDQPRAIAGALGMTSLFFATLRLEKQDYGIAVLSRYPLRLIRADVLPQASANGERRGAIWAEANVHGARVELLDTHLGLSRADREAQARALLGPAWLGDARLRERVIFCGDFNSPPSDAAYSLLSGALADAAVAARGASPRTWPSPLPVRRIDHVLVSRDLRVAGAKAPRSALAAVASDHLPLIVDLVLEPARRLSRH